MCKGWCLRHFHRLISRCLASFERYNCCVHGQLPAVSGALVVLVVGRSFCPLALLGTLWQLLGADTQAHYRWAPTWRDAFQPGVSRLVALQCGVACCCKLPPGRMQHWLWCGCQNMQKLPVDGPC